MAEKDEIMAKKNKLSQDEKTPSLGKKKTTRLPSGPNPAQKPPAHALL